MGTQMATQDLALALTLKCLHIDLAAKVGNDQAMLLRAQFTPFQLIFNQGVFTLCAGSPFRLNLVDAPSLATINLAFSHPAGITRSQLYSLTC
jgi:hypothetical protein